MTHEQRHDYVIWDRFLDLLFPCNDGVTDAEVDTDLKRFGIDMEPAFQRLHKMVAAQRAKSQLAAARATRTSLTEKLRGVVAPPTEQLRTNLRQWIADRMSGREQLAYFHKLESASTDDDLASLVDDLEKLAAFRALEDPNDPQSK